MCWRSGAYVKREGVKIAPAKHVYVADLDQIHFPDPVSMDLCSLRNSIERLYRKVENIECGDYKEDETD